MNKQRGAAILVVMLILLVTTVLGITAVRMGLTSLTIATNSQVNALLFQSADTGLIHFEQRVNANVQAAALPNGIIGPSLNTPGVEVLYCDTKTNILRFGGCQAGVAADFTSTRDAVISQVAVTVPAAADGSPMKSIVLGTDIDRAAVPTYRVNVHATSVLPVLGTASSTAINNCLLAVNDDSAAPATESVTDCLTDAGAVLTTTVQEYDFGFN